MFPDKLSVVFNDICDQWMAEIVRMAAENPDNYAQILTMLYGLHKVTLISQGAYAGLEVSTFVQCAIIPVDTAFEEAVTAGKLSRELLTLLHDVKVAGFEALEMLKAHIGPQQWQLSLAAFPNLNRVQALLAELECKAL
jgi:hypothetical protein